MKYPYIIFYRKEKYKDFDTFFTVNSEQLECTVFIASSLESVKQIHNSNYHLLFTYGDSIDEYYNELSTVLSQEMMIRHTHMNTISSITNVNEFNELVNNLYANLCAVSREKTRPTFSMFTPSFNSFSKIIRVYNSLKKQTLLDWEWIIVDDSPDDKNFEFLRNNFKNDARIRFFRRSCNNGSIGNVKNETIGLCRGKYVLEMDHDDELMPYVLQESAELFEKDPSVGFIYMDFAIVYENGANQWYGDFICKGYGGYYSQKYEDKWRLIYITPNINNITLSHLVCCPNHPRIWRRETLMEMGSYCEYLPICDDYEIILKTAVSTKIAKIHKLGYIQYMNDSENNFSLIRNSEINRIGPNYIYPVYFQKLSINDKMKELNAYEDELYNTNHSKIWERDTNTYTHKYCNLIINNDYDCQYCIIGFDSLLFYHDKIKELYKNGKNDFIVLENKCSIEYLQQRLDRYGFDRMKCYTLIDTDTDKLINYFKLLYNSTPNYEIFNVNTNTNKPKFNTTLTDRAQIINQVTKCTDRYLEIGVEYGETFNMVHFLDKIGVDPDPKFTPNIGQLYKNTSDEYFMNIISSEKVFDVIFIDGMHQAEYILRDINNCIKVLSTGGIIFIDDVLPFNYNEQLKIPIKHYYENGILKYGEHWTGDVWKVLYYILQHFNDKLSKFNYYNHINTGCVAMFQLAEQIQLDNEAIDEINNYDYFKEYLNYTTLMQTACK